MCLVCGIYYAVTQRITECQLSSHLRQCKIDVLFPFVCGPEIKILENTTREIRCHFVSIVERFLGARSFLLLICLRRESLRGLNF